MKIYWLDAHPAYTTYRCAQESDRDKMEATIQGEYVQDWTPFEIETDSVRKSSHLTKLFRAQFLVTERGKELLQQHTPESDVQFLPVHSPEGTMYILNALHTLDAIDLESSDTSGPSMGVYRYKAFELRPEAVSDHQLFKLYCPVEKRALDALYMSEELCEALSDQLIGYQAIEMWNSEKSWKQAEAEFQAIVRQINESLVEWCDYSEAVKRTRRGLTVYSQNYALKHSDDQGLLMGHLQPDGAYEWMDPVFIPPILLTMKWGLLEPEPTLWSRLKNKLTAKIFTIL